MISGRDGSGKSTARPKQIRRVLEADVASTAACCCSRRQNPRDARFEMAGRARQGERHKISPTIRSQHKPMLATPGGPIPRCTTRDWSRCSSQVWAVRVSGSGVPVPNPQNAQAAETRPGCSGTYRSPGNTPPHPSFRSRQHLLFWLGGPCGSESQQSAASKMQDNVSPSPS